jgi:ribonuclease P protein component
LAAPQRARTPHFTVHYLASVPGFVPPPPAQSNLSTGLSTAEHSSSALVDTPLASAVDSATSPRGCWLGLVIPKRHAKRAVTRNLLKRQVRAIAAACAAELPPGLWVVRLRTPFDRQVFTSPASDPLRDCARDELQTLFDRAVRTPLPPQAPRPASSSRRRR